MASLIPPLVVYLLLLMDSQSGQTVTGDSLEGCSKSKPLGMQSIAIPDKDLSASSSYGHDTEPQYARIRLDLGGGGWCPMSEVYNDTAEWLQIDLEEVKVITAVETQGRFNNTQMVRWYKVQYLARVDPQEVWQEYQDSEGNEKIKGNTNASVAVKQELDPPITAQRIRIIPQDTKPTYVCMRLELYGCSLQIPTTVQTTEMSTDQTTEQTTELTSELSTEPTTDLTTGDPTSQPPTLSTLFPAGGSRGFRYFPDLLYVFLTICLATLLIVTVFVVRKKRLQRMDMELGNTSENAALIT